jgi:DNA-binding NtrC family response regulator
VETARSSRDAPRALELDSALASTLRPELLLGSARRDEPHPSTQRSPRPEAVAPKFVHAMVPRVTSGYHDAVAACQRRTLTEALERTGGNKVRAADSLGMARSAFYKALIRNGLHSVKPS